MICALIFDGKDERNKIKKLLILLFSLLIMFTSVACSDSQVSNEPEPTHDSPNTYLPQIMLDDTLYYLSGESPLAIDFDENDNLGSIASIVPLSEVPTENMQANFGDEGAPYIEYGKGIAVLWHGEWSLFVTEDVLLSD